MGTYDIPITYCQSTHSGGRAIKELTSASTGKFSGL